MSVQTTATLLGDFVSANPNAARVLEAHGLDYCCGGRRSLADACAEAKIDADAVLTDLSAAPEATGVDATALDNPELIDHIVSIHHEYLWREMPRLTELANKVARVHGGNHAELREVQKTYQALVLDLTDHLMTEEQEQFPAIKAGQADLTETGLQKLISEHDVAGELLVKLRELTAGYTVPADGCASYQALYAGLAELETDLHTHIHKENNILFPRLLNA